MPRWLASDTPGYVWFRGTLLALIVIAGLLPGLFALPPIDRDESRFAQASRQMVNGGVEDWIIPKVGERVRLNKPPLVYWLQAMSARVFGGGPDSAAASGMWATAPGDMSTARAEDTRFFIPDDPAPARTGGIGWYRLPSAVCAVLAAVVTWLLGRDMLAGRWCKRDESELALAEAGAWLGGVFLGTCVMVLWDGRQARADQLLLLCTVLAVWGLWRCRREMLTASRAGDEKARPRWSSVLLLWIAVALGVLTKGPITPMVVVGAVIGVGLLGGGWRWALRLRWWVGGLALLAIVGAWVVLVVDRIGVGVYWDIVFAETIGRSAEAAEGHWGPPGYHLLVTPLVFWPASLFLFGAVAWVMGFGDTAKNERLHERLAAVSGLVGKLRVRAASRGEAGLFLVAWVVPCWVVFEAVTTKLPHYTLPLYPAIAIGSGWFVATVAAGGAGYAAKRFEKVLVTIALALGCVPALAPVLAAFALQPLGSFYELAVPAVFICSFVCWWCLVRRRRLVAGALASVSISLSTSFLIVGMLLPDLTLWISPQVTKMMLLDNEFVDPVSEDAPIALVRYQEDSLVFLTAGRAERVGVVAAPAWLAEHPDGVIVTTLDEGQWSRLFSPEGLLCNVYGVRQSLWQWGYHYNGGGFQRPLLLEGEAARLFVGWLAAERAKRRAERGLPAGSPGPVSSEGNPGGE